MREGRKEKMRVQTSLWNRRFLTMALVAAGLLFAATLGVKAEQSVAAEAKDQPYAIEYYYKAKWGHAEEFLALFKKNHYPVLKKEMELGRMLKVSMVTPRYHMTENSRWDYRVTIVFKNAAIANDNFDSSGIIKQLYPDQETYKKEEQRRFEILDAHWDLPIKDVDLDARRRIASLKGQRRGAEPEPDAKPAGLSWPGLMGAAQIGGRELRARIPGSAQWECLGGNAAA